MTRTLHDQSAAPILEALKIVEIETITGVGGPGHDEGRGATADVIALIGAKVFQANS